MKIRTLLVLLIPLLNFSCSVDEALPVEKSNVKIEEKLKAEDYYFARRENGSVNRLAQAVFKRGESVYFVLKNAGKVKRGNNGKHHVEIRMKVENSIGEIIAINDNLLFEKGVRVFKNDVLKTPNARYNSTEIDEPGKYNFTLTLVDFVANDSLVIASQFILE